jgi:hypothetical protein
MIEQGCQESKLSDFGRPGELSLARENRPAIIPGKSDQPATADHTGIT